MEIAFQTRSLSFAVIHTYLWSLLSIFMSNHGTESDIFCLKSIKEALEDPHNYLSSSWNFNNNTEGFLCGFTGVDCWHPDENKVLNLNLSYMGLKGQFPRAIQNCSSLSGLNLSHNELSGSIPSDVGKLVTYATSIDLSHNNFTGDIPKSLVNCTYLNVLKLDDNKLIGPIPPEFELLGRLRVFSVANNHLSGRAPMLLGANVDYANNEGLCGGILESCVDDDQSFNKSFKYSLIIGYVVSAASAAGFHISCCVPRRPRMQKKRRNIMRKAKKICESFSSIVVQMRELLPLRLLDEGDKKVFPLLEKMTSRMSFAEIHNATECFGVNNIIGFGKMGIMYEAELLNGWLLAVKRLSDPQKYKKQFATEIMILGKYKHRNIIHLLGFCSEGDERILVYQYMSNGRLSKWLHPLESEAARLEWPVRFKIALGIARGLSRLHHSRNVHIVHLNLSSKCILLDQKFQPKISNFGQARILNQSSGNGLGMSFFGPNVLALVKKDVFGFGSVLFEVITGKVFDEPADSSIFADISGNILDFYDLIDKSLVGKGFEDEIFCLLKVACECVQLVPDRRPTMLQVYENMSNIWQRNRFCDNSDIISKHSEIGSPASSDEIVEFTVA